MGKPEDYINQIPGIIKLQEPCANEVVRNKQVGGNHYQSLAIQPIDYILENKLNYCEGNVIKYVTRHKNKNGAEDIRKAIQYLQFILANDYGQKL